MIGISKLDSFLSTNAKVSGVSVSIDEDHDDGGRAQSSTNRSEPLRETRPHGGHLQHRAWRAGGCGTMAAGPRALQRCARALPCGSSFPAAVHAEGASASAVSRSFRSTLLSGFIFRAWSVTSCC